MDHHPNPTQNPEAATFTLPVIECPSCPSQDLGAFIGSRSGDVTLLNSSHYADRSGFLHCPECGLVWNSLHYGSEAQVQSSAGLRYHDSAFALDAAPESPEDYLEASAPFKPTNRKHQRLARTHARATRRNRRALARTVDRLYDAEALCTALHLPAAAKESVFHHVRHLSERADMRALCRYRSNGRTLPVRAEAITIATVSHVMERLNVERAHSVSTMLDALQFRDRPAITPDEYRAAYHSCAEWFAANLWRDGPEDVPIYQDSVHRLRE